MHYPAHALENYKLRLLENVFVPEPFDTIDEYRELDRYRRLDVERLLALSREFPNCAELYDFIGDVMQICDDDCYKIADSMNCYQQALKVDPTYAVAHESLGYAYDTYFDDFENAEKHFRQAVALGGRDSAKLGLARVLAQLGEAEEALTALATCDDSKNGKLIELRDEIKQGLWYHDTTEQA